MAERGFPFDNGPGSTITELDWSNMARMWQDDGQAIPDLNDTGCKITSLGEANTIYAEAGNAWIAGHRYENSSKLPITFPTNSSSNPRIDRVVLRVDRTLNTIGVAVLTGTPAVSPVAPATTNNDLIYEQTLALYTLPAGASTIAQANITDTRRPIGKRINTIQGTIGSPNNIQTGGMSYQPADGRFYTNGLGGVRAIPEVQLVRKTNTVTVPSNQGLVTDPDLQVNVIAGYRYLITGTVVYNVAWTGGINFSLGGPAASNSNNVWWRITSSDLNNPITTLTSDFPTPSTFAASGWTSSSVSADAVFKFEVSVFFGSTGGTVSLRTSNSASSYVLKQGSYIRAERFDT
jgi:hypothetical protein